MVPGLMVLLVIFLPAPALADEAAARVHFVSGQVFAISEQGDKRRLRWGDTIYSGDTLESRRASSAQLVFTDEGRMAVRADTTIKIQDYRYEDGDRGNSNSFIALLEGAVRSITGIIGKYNKNNVILTTPFATIGIRGTDHETIHIVDGDGDAPAGTYNRVYSGATILLSGGGQLNLDSNQVGFVDTATGNRRAPIKIDALPESIEARLSWKLPADSNRLVAAPPAENESPVRVDTDSNEEPETGTRVKSGVYKGKASTKGVAKASVGMSTALNHSRHGVSPVSAPGRGIGSVSAPKSVKSAGSPQGLTNIAGSATSIGSIKNPKGPKFSKGPKKTK